MPSTYSPDLRTRVLNDCFAGHTCTDTARKYSVSIAWVYNLRKQCKETGSIAPKKYQPCPKRKLEPYEQEVRQLVADHPDAALSELHVMLPNNDQVSVNTLHHFLRHLKMTYKKTLCAAEHHREDVAERRNKWQELQELFDTCHLIFIDETWTKTNMTMRCGWCERGKRLIDDVTFGHCGVVDAWQQHFWLHYVMMVEGTMVLDGVIHGD